MNDRLKYRVWDKRLNRYLGKNDPTQMLLENGNLAYLDDEGMKFYDVEFCTGLKDKNRKSLYEGDIIGGIYGGYISWCDECKSFELFVPEFGCASCSGDILWQEIVEDDGKLEVIGNIHENADLLENEE